MLKVLRSLFTLALLLAAGVALAAADVKPYARDDLASDVVRLTDTLRKETAQIGAKLKGKNQVSFISLPVQEDRRAQAHNLKGT